MTLLELAERCEKADGPDAALDADIAVAVFGLGANRTGEPFTASIDAAMTLVPEGWGVDLFVYPNGTANCTLRQWSPPCSHAGNIDIATPTLALCAASLRAIEGEG